MGAGKRRKIGKIVIFSGIICGLFLCFLSFIILLLEKKIRDYREQLNIYENRITTYEFLNRYHCWYGVFKVSYYTNHAEECGKQKSDRYHSITKLGTKAIKNWTVAVDPQYVKLGSILIDVESGQKYRAEDTGSKIKGYSIDIYLGEGTEENREKAKKLGIVRKAFIVIE